MLSSRLQELYGKKIAPLHMPIREDGKFVVYVNIVKNKARRYINKNERKRCPRPDYAMEYLEEYRNTLLESVAETSEEFMERFFEGDEFSEAEITAALAPTCMTAASSRSAWVPRSICRACATFWTISSATSRIRPAPQTRRSG